MVVKTNSKDDLDYSKVQVEVQDVSPETALQWLSAVPEWQRKKDQRQVKKLSIAIKNGGWRLNGATIVFDDKGNVIDGQHRLEAISLSGRTVKCIVVTGIPAGEDTFQTIGDEKPRRLNDFLHTKYSSTIAGVARLQWMLNHDMWPPKDGGHNAQAPIHEMAILVEPHLEFLERIAGELVEVGSLTRHHTFCTFIVYYYTKIYPYEVKKVVEFFSRLGSGVGLEQNDPIYRCRKRFIDSKTGSVLLSRAAGQGIILKALNYYFDDKKVDHHLTFIPGAQMFPPLRGTKYAEDQRFGRTPPAGFKHKKKETDEKEETHA